MRYLNLDAEISAQLEKIPQAEISFNYLGQFAQVVNTSSLMQIANEPSGNSQSLQGQRHCLLDINAIIANEQLQIDWTYSSNIHHWLQQQNRDLAAEFWRQKLQGFTTPTLLTVDKPLSGEQRSGYSEQQIQLTVPSTAAVVSFVRQHQLKMSNLVQATWGLLLSRYSQETDVVFGATVSGRPPELVGVESMVGLFINTLPVRVQISEKTELLGLLKDFQAKQVESEQFSYSSLVDIQGLSDVPRGTSLFESIVVFQNYPVDTAVLQGNSNFSLSNFRWIEQTNYPLTVLVASGEQLLLKVIYDASRFEDETISRMLGHFVTMLEAIATNPLQQISRLPILTKSEQQQLLVEWNDTQADYPQDKCIHQLFEEQVERTPDAVAVVFENQQLTYHELNCRANQLAHYLQSLGVGADMLVGICVERSLEMVVGLLGILKAGGAYVPLDPEYPQERLQFMLQDTQVKVLLTQHQARVVCLDTDWQTIKKANQDNLDSTVSAEKLSYVIYTSGSTGTPKGVAVTHQAVNRLVLNTNYIQLTPDDRVAQAANIAFDAATFEIWGALLHGAKLVIIRKSVLLIPKEFAANMRYHEVSVLFLTTALFNQLASFVPQAFGGLRYLLFGGEAVDPKWVEEVLDKGAPQHLLHVYGPTENTTFSSWYLVENLPTKATTIPIGRAISNAQVYLLDQNLQPVPIGVPGELHIAGVGLARGYLNRPDLTQEKFIPNPFGGSRGVERLYKTGDSARYLPDGNIEYLGRIDNQVKIRGFRVELGEIEAVLSQHEDVQVCCVIAREDIRGDKRLLAYIIPQPQITPIISQLRSFLKEKLPDYMVPSAFVILESLPLTPNGKVDRRALPAPEPSSELLEKYVAPRSPIEELTALYNAYSQGQPSPLLSLPIQYADFAIWQRQWLQGSVLNSQLSYWQEQLANAPTFLPLPTDRPRPAVQTFNGANMEFALSVELTQQLTKLSQKQGVTLFMTLLAAYNTLLYRYTGQTDILVGTPIANRDRTELEGLIGFFVNTLVMRTNLAENPSFNELLLSIREMALSAYAHQDLPFEMLVEALQPERDLSHTPLFQVMFILQNAPISEIDLTGLTVSELPIESATAKFDLTLVIS